MTAQGPPALTWYCEPRPDLEQDRLYRDPIAIVLAQGRGSFRGMLVDQPLIAEASVLSMPTRNAPVRRSLPHRLRNRLPRRWTSPLRPCFSMRAVGLALAFVLATSRLLGQSGAGADDPVSVPFIVSDGMAIVPAAVGSALPIHLIFDTGAGLDLLAPSLIKKVHGRSAGTFSAHRMTGERIDIPLFVIPAIGVGPVVRSDAVVGGWDVLDTLHVDGILSVNAFRERSFTIDFAARVLTFETAQSLARRRAAGRSSPLQVDDFRGMALDLFATFLLGTQPGQCEIDTGTQNAVVSMRYLAPLRIDKDGPDVVKRERRTIAGAPEVRYSTKLPQISLGAAPAIAIAQPSVSFSDITYDCVIGTDFWSGRALTIDIANRQLIVSDLLRAR